MMRLRKMYRNKSEEVRGWKKLHNEKFIIYLLKQISLVLNGAIPLCCINIIVY